MAESYSTSLRLTLIGDGDLSGTWGDVTNSNLGTLLEQAITGYVSVVMTDQNYTLKSYNGVADEARAAVLVATGTNTTTRQIIAPLVSKLYIVNNQTTGGYSITIGGSTGAVVTIPNGQSALVYCDGTNFYNGITVAASAATTIGGGSANQILYQASGSNTQFITAPSTAGSYLEWTGTSFTWNTPSAALAVGSSFVTGGTYGYVLYNNGGVLGNASTTGTGSVALNNSPSFIGVATFNNAPTVNGYPVLTSQTGVGLATVNNFTNTNSFSTTPTGAGGYTMLTTNTGVTPSQLASYAQLGSGNTFTGTNTFNSTNTYFGGSSSTTSMILENNSINWYSSVTGNQYNSIYYSASSTSLGSQQYVFNFTNAGSPISAFVFAGDGGAYKTGGGTWGTVSDARLKSNVAPLTGALAKISALNPVSYTWNYDAVGEPTVGFIAQDVQNIIPNAVNTITPSNNQKPFITDDKLLSIAWQNDMTAYLVGAIKELNTLVQTQAAQIAALQAKVGA